MTADSSARSTTPEAGAERSLLIDAIAAGAWACPGVARLDGGGFDRVVTYLPGRRVVGVRADPERIQVSVVASPGVSVASVADQVRRALAPLSAGLPVDVHIADVDVDVPAAVWPGTGAPASSTQAPAPGT